MVQKKTLKSNQCWDNWFDEPVASSCFMENREQPIYTLDQLLVGIKKSMVSLNEADKVWLQSTLGLELLP